MVARDGPTRYNPLSRTLVWRVPAYCFLHRQEKERERGGGRIAPTCKGTATASYQLSTSTAINIIVYPKARIHGTRTWRPFAMVLRNYLNIK